MGELVRRALSRRIRPLVYGVLIGFVVALMVAVESWRVQPSRPAEFLYLGLLGLAFVPLAILLVATGAYVVLRPRPLPKAHLAKWPRVAILYVVFNDMLPQAIQLTLRHLGDVPADLWLLTDSDRQESVEAEGRLPATVRPFQRSSRRGGKAGAINDWLRAHGDEYDYVVPMDADAILAPGTLRELLEIAEHPENARFAGFQTLMEVHPLVASTPFARIMGRGVRWGCRILPVAHQRAFQRGMYWGSNALLRTRVVRAVGGWIEDTICEDFALTARLDACGWPVALVDLYNYEGFPPDALSLRERTVRWCRANLSVCRGVFRQRTSFALRLSVLTPVLFYLMAPTLVALLVLNIVAPPAAAPYRLNTTLGVFLLAFVFSYRLIAVPRGPAILRRFAVTSLVETLTILGFALRITGALLEAPFRPPVWRPSRKVTQRLSWEAALRASLPEVSFGLLLVVLVFVFQPPVTTVVLAAVWIASFLGAPVVIWASARPGPRDLARDEPAPLPARAAERSES